MYDALHIANEFIRLGHQHDYPLTNLQIQKLVYFAHARLLGLHGTPLITQNVRAWEHGPVVRELYDSLKHCGKEPVQDTIPVKGSFAPDLRVRDIIRWSFDGYAQLNPFDLSKLTHMPDGPWDKARKSSTEIISPASIEKYYMVIWRKETEQRLEKILAIPQIQNEVAEGFAALDSGEVVTFTPETLREHITALET